MKVAHVTLYPPKNKKHVSVTGVASYSKNLITNIATSSEDEQVVIANILEQPEVYVENKIAVRRVFKRNPSFLLSVHKDLKKVNPDVIHIQQELALFGGIATAYLLQWLVWLWRKKVTITLHGMVDPDKVDARFVKENNSNLPVWLVRLAFRIIYTPLMKWSSKIIVHEQLFKDIAMKSYGINGDKISVIPHGVELLETIDQNEARTQLGLPKHAHLVLFMGYASGYKGLDLLVEGFAEYAKLDPHAYVIIGAGKHPKLFNDSAYLKEYERLQKKAEEYIPSRQYRWEGFIKESEITSYYSASDVSVYPYTTALSSSGPMSFAIGYEKPFLVSTAFDAVFGQYPVLLFKKDARSFADRLSYFFTYKQQFSEISHELKQQRTWNHVAQLTLQVYRQSDQKGRYETEESFTAG